MKVVHEHVRWPLKFSLMEDGVFMVRNMETDQERKSPWYMKDDGEPWMVRTLKSFKRLVAMADKDGDFDDLKGRK